MSFTARSTEEIYNEIALEKSTMSGLTSLQPDIDNSQTLAEDLTKTSKVAIWRIFSYVIAYVISIFERNMEEFRTEINDVYVNRPILNDLWLIDEALKFQDGDSLVLNESNYEYGYITEDASKQIVKYATLENRPDVSILKVRKESSELSIDELGRFQTYINIIKPLNARISVRSVEADRLKLYYNIVYTGEKILTNLKSEVQSTIESYLSSLEFNSEVKISKLTNLLLEIEGIDDVEFLNAIGKDVNDTETTFTRTYKTYAGWAKLDPSVSLDDTITYIVKTNY